jgi:hypothetical protein
MRRSTPLEIVSYLMHWHKFKEDVSQAILETLKTQTLNELPLNILYPNTI